jgi:predicted TIM-barrel fold metal-dependent hydrolase
MRTVDQNGRITRRGFFERGARAVAGAGMLATGISANAPDVRAQDAVNANSGPMPGKIAFEEHFVIPETLAASYGALGSPEFQRRLEDIGSARIAEMDRGGLDVCILSLVGDGIQAIPDVSEAIRIARRANDHLAEEIAKNPKRFKGFAALPLQDPQAAAQELTRCIRELGFCGAMVNGYSQIGTVDSIVFYDLPQYRDFWATVQQLDVPFYLHPRSAPAHLAAYEGHAWLTGSVWGFTSETAIHTLRLTGSGLFDDYPKLKIILGHLGEGLPCNIWRIDNRVSRTLGAKPKAKLPIGHYLRENFYITTSGNFCTQTLTEVMMEVGADRILYSVDFPFEDVAIAADWFDHAAISEADRSKIGRSNAAQLFRI